MYKDQIVLFSGGIHEYIGEIDQGKHKLGDGWWRIKKPCVIETVQKPGGKLVNHVVPFHYPENNFRKYVDIYIPPGQTIIEIRTLAKEGRLYEEYQKSLKLVPANRIVLASDPTIK